MQLAPCAEYGVPCNPFQYFMNASILSSFNLSIQHHGQSTTK